MRKHIALGIALGLAICAAVYVGQAWSALTTHRSVSTGAYHTCVTDTQGAVSCWGWGAEGALGNGSAADRHVPTPVPTLKSGVAQLSSNYNRTCALTIAGVVWCWGRSPDGPQFTPKRLSNVPKNTTAIAVGKNLACLIAAGKVYCWDSVKIKSPKVVAGLSNVSAVDVGRSFACALIGSTMKCWGTNPLTVTSTVPTVKLTNVTKMSMSGDFGCALQGTAIVKCWGENDHGQLGNDSTVNSITPVMALSPGTNMIDITAGANHACTLDNVGNAKCWGRNDFGEVGDGTTVDRHLPTPVTGLGSDAITIEAGGSGHFVCVLTSAHIVKCWGRNQYGQLGDGTTQDRLVPTTIMELT